MLQPLLKKINNCKKDSWFINGIVTLLVLFVIFVRLIPVFTMGANPAGDSYMAVLWARVIEKTNNIPNYQEIAQYWGKPGEIYFTPNLHVLLNITHHFTGLSIESSVILLLVLAGSTIPIILFSIAKIKNVKFALLVLFISSIGLGRSFRYFSTPGYHFQNLFGDLIIAFLIFNFILIVEKIKEGTNRKRLIIYLIIFSIAINSLLLYHQLSSFIGLFILFFVFIFILILDKDFRIKIINKKTILFSLPFLILFLLALLFTKYNSAIFQLFGKVNPDNDLYKLMRPFSIYPKIWGNDFVLYLGIFAFFFIIINLVFLKRNKKNYLLEATLIIWLFMPFILSKAPLLYIKLMPLRLFWYIGYPLVLAVAYLIFYLIKKYNWPIKTITAVSVFIIFATISIVPISTKSLNKEEDFYGMDSSYNNEVQEINNWLLNNLEEKDTIYLDVFNYKNLIWTWSDIIPEKIMYIKIYSTPNEYFEKISGYNKDGRVYLIFKKDHRVFESFSNSEFEQLFETENLIIYKDLKFN